MFFRFIFVNIFSFIKRFFAFSPTIYNIIVVLPLLTALSPSISKRSAVFIFVFSLILLATGNIASTGSFAVYYLLLLAIPMFKKVNFEQLVSRSFWFFVIVCLYGLSQKFFGYSIIEKRWIQSGLSFADEREFLTDDIRPFSTFASMPEFTFFIAIFVYHFKVTERTGWLIFAFVMLYIAGSRGVFVSVLVGYFFTFVVKRHNSRYLFIAFLASLLIFFALVFVFPILFASLDTSSRMLAYGTFNGRIELLTKVLDQGSIMSIFTGLNIQKLDLVDTFDNMYFMLLAHGGIFGCIYFLFFILKQKINKKNFYFLTIFLGYGFYADVVFSYYLMFLFFFAIYSYSDEINNYISEKLAPPLKGNDAMYSVQ